MKTLTKFFVLFVSTTLCASVWAQVSSITVGSGNGLPGATGIVVPVSLTANGDNIAGIDMSVTFTTASQYSVISVDCSVQTVSSNIFPSCNVAGNVVTIQLAETAANPWVSGLLANITVDIAGGAVPLVDDPLAALIVGASDNTGTDIPFPTTTDGTFTVLAGPQPDWSSTPDSATGFDFGSHSTGTGLFPLDLVVTNAGDPGSTLTGSCVVTGSAVFSIAGDNTLGAGLAMGASASIVAVCNTTGAAVQLHTGTMSCTHNGDGTTETSITDYALDCNVTASPEPSFLGVDSGLSAMDVPEQGDPDATATLTVSNNGDSGTTLIGSCVYAGDTEIAVTNGAFAVAQGDPGVDVLATCSGAVEGTYTGTLTCGPTGPQTWVAADSPYAVSCTVGPPGDAVYESNPADGSTIDMTPPGSPVEEGSVIPTQALVITNNPPEADDRDLALLNCGLSGAGPITATAASTPLAPNASTTVTFSCDSATAGDYTETYSCPYDVDGDGAADGTASYTVNCAVRLAESDVTVIPASGSTLTITVAPGGGGQRSIIFQETADEGEDGTLDSCSLADGTNFTILEPVSFPADIPTGGSLAVLVEGIAADDGEPVSTTLTCTYSDSNVSGEVVTWTVEVVVRDIPIPTLSSWGMSLLILTLLGLGGIIIRRRAII